MKKAVYFLLGVSLLAIGVLTAEVSSLSKAIDAEHAAAASLRSAQRDTLSSLQLQVDSLRLERPGLGEYMSAIQLHVSKLWFAARASNWGLSLYELNELGEAIDGARSLHAIRDSVNVAGVLQSVSNTQIQLLKQAIQEKRRGAFISAYNQTLDACNSCHRAAGYGFIHIITPASQPVTNQRWEMSTK